jgi:transcriptional regulator with XRE-family HTH domain
MRADPPPPEAAVPRELRAWRQRRGLSQLELALQAGTTPRHLSFLETGRSRPGAEMVLRLARCLDVPLRQRNQLLRAAGHPPAFAERGLGEAAMGSVRAALRWMLDRHEPFPAYVLDGRGRLVEGNAGGRWLWALVGDAAREKHAALAMLESPTVWAALENRAEVGHALADALERDALATGDPGPLADLEALRARLLGTPRPPDLPAGAPVICPRLRWGGQTLRTLTTVCRFGNSADVTLDELRVELIFPADAATDAALRALGSAG